MRSRATTALALSTSDELKAKARSALEKIATDDRYALVRESALRALKDVAGDSADAFIRERAKSDAEEQVRAVAAALAP